MGAGQRVREPEEDRGRLIAWGILVAALAALAYSSRLTGGKPPKDVVYDWTLAIGGAVIYALILGVVLLISRGPHLRALLALRPPASWALAAWLGGGVLVGVFLLGLALEPVLQGGEEQGLTPSGWQPNRAAGFVANFVVIAGIAPLVEELTYRGLGFSLLELLGRNTALLLSSLAFGLAHGLFEALPLLFAFGLGLAYLRARTGSVYPCVLLHALFNGFALIAAVTY